MLKRTTISLALFISLASVSLFFSQGPTWVDAACEGNCRNADFLGNDFWHVVRNSDNTMTLFVNGFPSSSPPQIGSTPNMPALKAYNGQVLIVVRGTDPNHAVWVNRWTGSSWIGWFNLQMGTTTNSPDMNVFGNVLYLFVSGTDGNKQIWKNSFTTFWPGWGSIGAGGFDSAQTCSSSLTIRAGGCKTSGCFRHASVDGNIWTGPFAGDPCP